MLALLTVIAAASTYSIVSGLPPNWARTRAAITANKASDNAVMTRTAVASIALPTAEKSSIGQALKSVVKISTRADTDQISPASPATEPPTTTNVNDDDPVITISPASTASKPMKNTTNDVRKIRSHIVLPPVSLTLRYHYPPILTTADAHRLTTART